MLKKMLFASFLIAYSSSILSSSALRAIARIPSSSLTKAPVRTISSGSDEDFAFLRTAYIGFLILGSSFMVAHELSTVANETKRCADALEKIAHESESIKQNAYAINGSTKTILQTLQASKK